MELIVDICIGFLIPIVYFFIGCTCAGLFYKTVKQEESESIEAFGCLLAFIWPIMVPFITVIKLSSMLSDWIYKNIKR